MCSKNNLAPTTTLFLNLCEPTIFKTYFEARLDFLRVYDFQSSLIPCVGVYDDEIRERPSRDGAAGDDEAEKLIVGRGGLIGGIVGHGPLLLIFEFGGTHPILR